jgi:hypothetical protein
MFIQKSNLPKRTLTFNSNNLTKEQQVIYNQILKSKKGIEIVNKLKNEALLKDEKSIRIYHSIFSFLKPKTKIIIDSLFLDSKKTKVNNQINSKCFNRLTFKELNITKIDILNNFRKHNLINF